MPNHLANQTSPYLLQHANNPVDWYPWGNDALTLAKKENKPILLSIGYSACHWCHVMAHESFEDKETAALMNKLFVNIKVDREERPDLDKIYQAAHHIMNQRGGGWPLTVFLRPDNHLPFFAGTYFPKEPRGGMLIFKELMQRVSEWFRKNPDALEQHSKQMADIFQRMSIDSRQSEIPDHSVFDTAYQQLTSSFDPQHGGFGGAPKFPHPTNIERLLRHWYHKKSALLENDPQRRKTLHMVTFTLQKMALGGMYDQLGGGFCRYSVDEAWMIPHFEKMLYDNGPLLALYAQAFAATGNPLFERIITETAEWVIREMQSPEGGYYSTLDADSEGEEGKFYVWGREEVQHCLTPTEYEVFSLRFGLDQGANFEGRYNPHVFQSTEQIEKSLNLDAEAVLKELTSAKEKLFQIREQRIRPGRDEKILTAWNGLMIKGMALAARHCGNHHWLESAERSLEFVHNTLWKDDRLLATHKDGKTHLNAYLDDYAFLIDGVLELLQVRWNTEHLNFACNLADVLLRHFEDKDNGAFYFTSDDHEPLIQRPKPFFDEAIPAGNGIAAYALQRLGHLVGKMEYVEAAEQTLRAAATTIKDIPSNCNALLLALEEYLTPTTTLIIRGEGSSLHDWHERTSQSYAPNRMVFAIPNHSLDLPEALAMKTGADATTAYLCAGTSCSAPITDLETLIQQIE